jgi:hypothetical protein
VAKDKNPNGAAARHPDFVANVAETSRDLKRARWNEDLLRARLYG